MKILWVKSDFLHPTTKGGHIRTLEMLRKMHARHEIHYVGCHDGRSDEGPRRSVEYCTRSYAVPFQVSSRGSARFLIDVGSNLFSSLPVHVTRPKSEEMRRTVSTLMKKENFDAMVCDFLTPCISVPELDKWVLFQHNVETMIWRLHAEAASDPLRRWYFKMQADRLFAYEKQVCQTVRHVIAVSESDAALMSKTLQAPRVSHVPTGVDIDYFTPREKREPEVDLVFVGSMDWSPNVDGMLLFCREILPLIRKKKPDCTVAVVGRDPVPSIRALGEIDPLVLVLGTVPDVRPHLWNAKVSIVPLRIGGGTRLKIYEAQAARVPVVSTTIGAEGLFIDQGRNIHIADAPEEFAARCLDLLGSPAKRQHMAHDAWTAVRDRFSWEQVALEFEAVLERTRHAG
jgi:glycosyltransferase involved in cell wall biosynthesis